MDIGGRPLGPRARDRARRTLTAGLRCAPDRLFAPLRRSFALSPPNTMNHRLQHAILRTARYRGLPAQLDSFALSDNPSVRIVNADSFIVEWLYWFGEQYGYEASTIHWWKCFCARSSSIVDFGANIGYYAVQGALNAPAARYTAIEPHPGGAALCRRNLELNGIRNVDVVEAAAVGDISTPTVELLLPGGRDHYTDAPCGGFVGVNAVHGVAENRSSYTSVTVPTVPISSVVTSDTDLIKMDVEGQEHTLLSAVLGQLKETRPPIFLELLNDTSDLRTLIIDELMPHGYRCLVPTAQTLVPLSAADVRDVSLVDDYGTRDIVLTPSRDVAG